jgi:6-pyruvoyltetrahydropterin/6-carboxytetrahydropterin synthase
MFSLVFSRRYSMAHRFIAGNSEKCAVPHGHNEIVTVHLKAVDPSPLDGVNNMVEPFERAKARWHRWVDDYVDHALQLSEADPLLEWFVRHEPHRVSRILVTPGDPTTEALACCMMAKLNAFLKSDGGRLACAEIRIEETPTNAVTFEGDPLSYLVSAPGANPWWKRADMTINDLLPVRTDSSLLQEMVAR